MIPNGRAKGHRPSEFEPHALARGTRHEMEHTTSKRVAQRIAMDHLIEDPAYYRKLAKMERGRPAMAKRYVKRSGRHWVVVDRNGRVISRHRTKRSALNATYTITPRRRRRHHEPEGELEWRARQRRGRIMRRRTFEEIEEEARERGARNPRAVAGAAYWRTVRAKYKRGHRRSAR